MKLSVLMDNNTIIDRYFAGEPGVSYYIETGGKKILFDTGYSDLFIKNAENLGIDLTGIDCLVLSHGHIDHTGGLDPLIKLFMHRKFENLAENEAAGAETGNRKPDLVAHPGTFQRRKAGKSLEIGPLVTVDTLSEWFSLEMSRDPLWVTDRLVFLGEIERTNNFEAGDPVGTVENGGAWKDDFVYDDSALVYLADRGMVIITGCSHSGICNITEYAKKITGESRVADIIGGFHLLNPPADQISGTVEYFKEMSPLTAHPCHCTDLNSRIALSKAVRIEETGSGLVLNYG